MRLIDADMLSEHIDHVIECKILCTNHMRSDRGCDGNCSYEPLTDREKAIIQTIEKILREQPTIDAEPVVHGRWVDRKDMITEKCSCCGNSGFANWVYCPGCGAKMDGEG